MELSTTGAAESGRVSTGEVWDSYCALGTAMPQHLPPDTLNTHLALVGERFPSERWAAQKLRGFIHYEAGITHHVDEPDVAASHFMKAVQHLDNPRFIPPYSRIKYEAMSGIAQLMLARRSKHERQDRYQQELLVRRLGRMIFFHSGKREPDSPDRGYWYGYLIEAAFTATFLADTTNNHCFVAAPTTERQDRPRAHRKTMSPRNRPYNEACDLNLYGYQGIETEPSKCVRTQLKSTYRDDSSSEYHPDIAVLYGDRDLFIENFTELRTYGKELANYDREHPGRGITTALSNIDLALSNRDQHAETWRNRPESAV